MVEEMTRDVANRIPLPELRAVCVASWHAARLQARDSAIPLNVCSAAGLAVTLCGDARVAMGRIVGQDDWAIRVRALLSDIAEEEARNPRPLVSAGAASPESAGRVANGGR